MFNSHLANKTTPSALFYNKFPEPFLNDDFEYVKQYNDLISVFQSDVLALSKSFLEKRIKTLESKLNDIKSNLIENNADSDINNSFAQIITQQNTILRERFEKANAKACRAKSIPFVSGKKTKKANNTASSTTNQSFTSGTSFSSSILRNSRSPSNNRYSSSNTSQHRVNFESDRNNLSSSNQHSTSSFRNSNNSSGNSRNNNYRNNYRSNTYTSTSNFNPYALTSQR